MKFKIPSHFHQFSRFLAQNLAMGSSTFFKANKNSYKNTKRLLTSHLSKTTYTKKPQRRKLGEGHYANLLNESLLKKYSAVTRISYSWVTDRKTKLFCFFGLKNYVTNHTFYHCL